MNCEDYNRHHRNSTLIFLLCSAAMVFVVVALFLSYIVRLCIYCFQCCFPLKKHVQNNITKRSDLNYESIQTRSKSGGKLNYDSDFFPSIIKEKK